MTTPLESLIQELAQDPCRPALIIDERRFGRDMGFDEERVVFAGVLTTMGDLLRFGGCVERVRNELDKQKSSRAIKASDIVRGRLAERLRSCALPLLDAARISYWATTTAYLSNERRARTGPAAVDVNSGRAIDGRETPVIAMIAGRLSDTEPQIRAAGRLEVFVDRSVQNGMHEPSKDFFTVFHADGGAPATHEGSSILLGAGVKRRFFAVCEETRVLGDLLIPADLSAHLWAYSAATLKALADGQLSTGVKEFGTASGRNLVWELEQIPTK